MELSYKLGATRSVIENQRLDIIGKATKEIEVLFDNTLDICDTFWPKQTEPDTGKSNPDTLFKQSMKDKISQLKTEIETYLTQANQDINADRSIAEYPNKAMPVCISKIVLKCLTRLLSRGKGLEGNDYYQIDRVRKSLGLDKATTRKLIDMILFENRKSDFERLVQNLDQDQRFQFAFFLYQAIQADDKVHPAELNYLQNINQLLGNDEITMETLENKVAAGDDLPKLKLDPVYSDFLFTQLVEIVLCDEEFDVKESDFIDRVAEILDIDESRQNEVENSIAMAFVAKSALFD